MRSPAVQHERDLLQGHAASVRQEDGGEDEGQDGAAGEEEEGDVRTEVVVEVGEVAGHQEGDEPVVGRGHRGSDGLDVWREDLGHHRPREWPEP